MKPKFICELKGRMEMEIYTNELGHMPRSNMAKEFMESL